MNKTFQYIKIPFDELQVFKKEEQFEVYLKQTLLLSTLVSTHWGKLMHSCKLIITKKHLWLIKNSKKLYPLKLKHILSVIKSTNYPQLVIITEQSEDNIRITTTTQQRCKMIISALTYEKTMFRGSFLTYYQLNQQNLEYFERDSQQKLGGKNFDLSRYYTIQLIYKIPSSMSIVLYGQQQKVAKLILKQKIGQQDRKSIYIAKIQQQMYICEVISCQNIQDCFQNHKNQDFIIKMCFVKKSEYKLLAGFQFYTNLNLIIMPLQTLFISLCELYDKFAKMNTKLVFCTELLCLANNSIKLKQFRYKILYNQCEFNKVIYQSKRGNFNQQKFYNICLVYLELKLGRCYFDRDTLEQIIYIKQQCNELLFPSYMRVKFHPLQLQLLNMCFSMSFQSTQDLLNHKWFARKNKESCKKQ